MKPIHGTVCLVVALLITSLGCNNGPDYPVGEVSGKLTLKGNPIKGDVELFLMDHKTGFAYKALVTEDGGFEVNEPVRVGNYVAYVQPAVDLNLSMDGAPTPTTATAAVPAKYTNDARSDLLADVKEGPNHFAFDMK